ncbi:MAG TPA: hypothetical protein VHV55_17335 [Pirellulales bacterium]|jgi:hypothetical protein|nr:hypothetical protein [Pirellulales bacterium]
MNEKQLAAEPTASDLKNELRTSLGVLKEDFERLKSFVAEFVPNESSAPVSLTKEDRDDLLSIAAEIHDAASDIEFEADKIKDTLSGFII